MSRAASSLGALVAAVVLAPAACRADDEAWAAALHTEFEEGDLSAAAKLYRELGDERATYRLLEVAAKAGDTRGVHVEAERFLKRFPGSRLTRRVQAIAKAPRPFVEEQVRKRNTERKRVLHQTKLSLDLSGAPLRQVAERITQATGLTVVLLPEVDSEQPVSAKVKEVSARSALRMVLAPLGLHYAVTCGAVVVGKTPETLRPPSFALRKIKRNPSGYLALKVQRVSLNFEKTPLGQALAFMKDVTGQEHELGAGLDPGTLISLQLKDVTFEEGLTLLTARAGATYVLTKEGLRVRPAE